MSSKARIWMIRVMHYFMLSCDTATFYIIKSDYQKLSYRESIQLKVHLMGCGLCRNFKRQNAIISEKLRMMQQEPPGAELSAEKKAEIEKALKEG